MPDNTDLNPTAAADPKPNLAMGYRIAAGIFGGVGLILSPLTLIISIPGGIFFMLICFLFFYIGVSRNQTSWAAKVLKALGFVYL